jgi:hypothetical protein
MSDTTRTAMARRGTFYLVAGVLGVLMAVYFVIEGCAELWQGHLASAFSRLVLGAIFGAASVRVLQSWRDLRSVTKR